MLNYKLIYYENLKIVHNTQKSKNKKLIYTFKLKAHLK